MQSCKLNERVIVQGELIRDDGEEGLEAEDADVCESLLVRLADRTNSGLNTMDVDEKVVMV